jgi:hypothetical protein
VAVLCANLKKIHCYEMCFGNFYPDACVMASGKSGFMVMLYQFMILMFLVHIIEEGLDLHRLQFKHGEIYCRYFTRENYPKMSNKIMNYILTPTEITNYKLVSNLIFH